jgi:hypothetical protein
MHNIFRVRFKILAAASVKMTVFWKVVPFRLVDIYWRFGGVYCLVDHWPGAGGSKHLRNFVILLSDFKARKPRKRPSSIFTEFFFLRDPLPSSSCLSVRLSFNLGTNMSINCLMEQRLPWEADSRAGNCHIYSLYGTGSLLFSVRSLVQHFATYWYFMMVP